jgi:hypothetical protein
VFFGGDRLGFRCRCGRKCGEVDVGQADDGCSGGRLPLDSVAVPEDDVDEVPVGLIEDGVFLGN